MRASRLTLVVVFAGMAGIAACGRAQPSPGETPLATPPAPEAPLAAKPLPPQPGQAVAVVAGGCFWGVEAVYRHTRGVKTAVSGYAGGTAETATYALVSSGSTDHAESVEVTYDPSVITYDQILRIFFTVAHDPTELNRQGPDEGRQYRSAIFATDKEQERVARAYVARLNSEGAFPTPVVTEVVPLTRFYAAESYHQNYAALHPDEMYIRVNDAPKIERLREVFPDWFVTDKAK